jgi:hypothetical protein
MAICRTTECRKSKSDSLSCDGHGVSSGNELNSLFRVGGGGKRRNLTMSDLWEVLDRTVARGTSGYVVDRPLVFLTVLYIHRYVR